MQANKKVFENESAPLPATIFDHKPKEFDEHMDLLEKRVNPAKTAHETVLSAEAIPRPQKKIFENSHSGLDAF